MLSNTFKVEVLKTMLHSARAKSYSVHIDDIEMATVNSNRSTRSSYCLTCTSLDAEITIFYRQSIQHSI